VYPRWLLPLVLLAFIAHAANYLYFFVDDEAIVMVFAQNLLGGNGLSYSASEGPLEGYANFLHILLSAGWLAAVQLAGVSKLWVFAVGSLWSFLVAIGTILLAARLMSAVGTTTVGAVAGLGFLALAGPFAAWAITSLETVTVALLCLALIAMLTAAPDPARDRLAAATAVVLLLYRVDGFVFVGAAFAAAFTFGGTDRRRTLLRTIVPLTVLFGALYWAWRIWYFGTLLPMPFYAKTAFRLLPAEAVVMKLPETPYLVSFAAMYWYVPLVALAMGWMGFTRDRRLWAIFAMLAACVAYVHMVGDWMFGFRFVVPLLPLAAILVAATVTQLAMRWRMAGAAACALILAASAVAAVQLARTPEHHAYPGSWYRGPSLSSARYFGHYHSVVEALRPHVQPGDRIAYNQAGLVAFLLELDNLDNLGLCSRFYARLPTRDVIFTEVGRYTALTNKPALRATEMFMLRHQPRYILETVHLLRVANGEVPSQILGGRYRLAYVDPRDEAAVYEPAAPLDAAVHDPSRYYENLAHPANLREARIGAAVLPRRRYLPELRYLAEQTLTRDINDSYAAVLTLPEDSVVSEIFVDRVQTSVDGRAVLALFDGTREVYTHQAETEATRAEEWHLVLPLPIRADRVMLTVSTVAPGLMRLGDLRVLGQTPTLRAFITEEFAARSRP
jgi:arabinofuranosyltransferase